MEQVTEETPNLGITSVKLRKARTTSILTIRLENELLNRLNERIAISEKGSRNSWLIWAIEQGLRDHNKK